MDKQKQSQTPKRIFHLNQRGKMKIPITVKIEHDIKILFESMKSIHGKTFTDALAEGIDHTLSGIISVDLLEMEVAKKEDELHALRQDLIKAKSVQVATDMEQSQTKEMDEHTEKIRVGKFTTNEKSLLVQWNKSNINWQGFMNAYQFDNKKEARAWLQNMLIKNDLI